MTEKAAHGLFITGTNTEVGKTHVAAMIARALAASGLAVGVYKPVASGCRREGGGLVSDDAVALWEAAGRPGTLQDVCPQRFEAPVAPHVAAEMAGRAIDERLLIGSFRFWAERADVVIVEGAGGLMSPLTRTAYNADFAAELGLPLVVVAANELGVINTTLQTLITRRRPPPAAPGRRRRPQPVPPRPHRRQPPHQRRRAHPPLRGRAAGIGRFRAGAV